MSCQFGSILCFLSLSINHIFHTLNHIYTHRQCRRIAFIFLCVFLLIQKLPVVSVELVAHRQTTRMQPAMNAHHSLVAGLTSHWKKRWVAVNDSAWAASPCCWWPPKVKVAWNTGNIGNTGRTRTGAHLKSLSHEVETCRPWILNWCKRDRIASMAKLTTRAQVSNTDITWRDNLFYCFCSIPVQMRHHYDIYAYPHDNMTMQVDATTYLKHAKQDGYVKFCTQPRPWSTSRRNRFAKDLPLLLGQKCKRCQIDRNFR